MRISDWSSDVCSSDLFVKGRIMPDLNTISSDKLVRLVGIASGPVVIDVRPEDEFATDPLLIPGTLRRAADDIGIWADDFTGRSAVIACRTAQESRCAGRELGNTGQCRSRQVD